VSETAIFDIADVDAGIGAIADLAVPLPEKVRSGAFTPNKEEGFRGQERRFGARKNLLSSLKRLVIPFS
jgi:hypothetical protein